MLSHRSLDAAGGAVLIARYLGEKKPDLIGPVTGGAAVAGVCLSIGCYLYRNRSRARQQA